MLRLFGRKLSASTQPVFTRPKLTVETPEQGTNFEHIQHLVLVFLLLTCKWTCQWRLGMILIVFHQHQSILFISSHCVCINILCKSMSRTINMWIFAKISKSCRCKVLQRLWTCSEIIFYSISAMLSKLAVSKFVWSWKMKSLEISW